MNEYDGSAEFMIKSPTVNDIPLILNLIKELAVYEKNLDKVVATEESLQQALFSNPPSAEVILGYYQNHLIGFALFVHNYSSYHGNVMFLEDLYVKPEFREKGFGKNMLQHIASIALRKHCKRLEWWCLDWNKPAIDFYQRIGAKPLNNWTIYQMTEDALKQLSLSSISPIE